MGTITFYIIISFVISLTLGKITIPILKRLKLGQHIREEGPKSHMTKAGTPTMGGIIFIFSSIITMMIAVNNYSSEGMIALLALVLFGAIGALDDLLSIMRGKNEGLTPFQKMVLLIAVSLIFAYYAVTSTNIGTRIIIPFIKDSVDLKIMYIPFIIFYFTSTTNAANLTDGLDGLASTISLFILIFLSVTSFAMGHYTLCIFAAVISGALLGFLCYNSFPARVIMGDTGSLALGGAIATIAMMLQLPLLIPIVGGIFFLEDLSVLIQIISFRTTGKRVFKMSPLHHHFELSGWHETRIVAVFSIITVILCLISLLALPSLI